MPGRRQSDAPPKRTPATAGARRVGYAIAAVINVALLYLINVRQGWQAVLFLTEDTSQAEVLSWV